MISLFGWPEETEDLLGWVPGSVKDESWAECGNLAMKELLTEICFPLTRTRMFQDESCSLRLPFLVRTKNNIHLVETTETALPDYDLT